MAERAVRVGIVGAGAIGGFCGVLLARAGCDVHFLLRSEYEVVRQRGLLLKSNEYGDVRLASVNAYRDVAQMPPCDWLLVTAKTTGNRELAPSIVRAAAPQGRVLLLQNGLGLEDGMRSSLPDSLHLLGGVCLISAHRQGGGVIDHHGLGRVILGYHSGPTQQALGQREVIDEAAALFRAAGLEVQATDDLARSRWQKLLMNIPFSGLTLLLDSGTRGLMAQPQVRALVRELMEEVAAGAALCGHPLPRDSIEKAWAAHDTAVDYRSSMQLDYAARHRLELQAIYAAPLEAVARAGGSMPRVRMLYQVLCFLDERNRA